jgi:hypothetical protein
MTCVWDALIRGVDSKLSPHEFVSNLKLRNVPTGQVLWNGQRLSEQHILENLEWINSLEDIGNGHFCSNCDAVLLLVCQLYQVNIEHNTGTSLIRYECLSQPKPWLMCRSNRGHFWLDHVLPA